MTNVTVVGADYVDLTSAVLLGEHNEFLDMDLNAVKTEQFFVYDVKSVLPITSGRL